MAKHVDAIQAAFDDLGLMDEPTYDIRFRTQELWPDWSDDALVTERAHQTTDSRGLQACAASPSAQRESAMMKSFRIVLSIFLAGFVASCASGRYEPPATQSPGLVSFASEEGMVRLARSTARADFPALANQFEAQYNTVFCGPATAAIVLNALVGRSDETPRDGIRFRPDDFTHVRAQSDLTLPRYTQDNVIDKGPKKRSQVFGEPVLINNKQVRDLGYQVRQLEALFKAGGIPTRLVIVDDAITEKQIRADLVQNLKRPGDYVVVNYRRRDVGQQGGGHISPVGAYDSESDSFLVLDVNPAAAGWVWMPTAILVKGMRTFDTIENRGYILVGPR